MATDGLWGYRGTGNAGVKFSVYLSTYDDQWGILDSYVKRVSIIRGKGVLPVDDYEPSRCTVVLDNDSGIFSPFYEDWQSVSFTDGTYKPTGYWTAPDGRTFGGLRTAGYVIAVVAYFQHDYIAGDATYGYWFASGTTDYTDPRGRGWTVHASAGNTVSWGGEAGTEDLGIGSGEAIEHCLFSGPIWAIQETYDEAAQGSTITLTCADALTSLGLKRLSVEAS